MLVWKMTKQEIELKIAELRDGYKSPPREMYCTNVHCDYPYHGPDPPRRLNASLAFELLEEMPSPELSRWDYDKPAEWTCCAEQFANNNSPLRVKAATKEDAIALAYIAWCTL